MSNKIIIKIKKLHPDATIPQYAHKGDAGFDLVAVEDTIIESGETKLVKTGLAMEIPIGYELQVRPRSGISLKTKLRISNAPGTIDCQYTGDIGVIVDNINHADYEVHEHFDYNYEEELDYVGTYTSLREGIIKDLEGSFCDGYEDFPLGTYLIRKGDRIAQGVLNKVPQAEFIVVSEGDELSDSERGAGGFGSSGVKASVDVKHYCDDGIEVDTDDWDGDGGYCKHFKPTLDVDSECVLEPYYCAHFIYPDCGLK